MRIPVSENEAPEKWAFSLLQVTLELTKIKTPPAVTLAQLFENNREALLQYLLTAALAG